MNRRSAHTSPARRPAAIPSAAAACAPPVDFGALLLAHRRRAGMTQQQIADLATLSVRAIRDLEAGRARHPRRDTVRLLGQVLRLSGPGLSAFEAAARSRPEAEPALDPAFAPPLAPSSLIGREEENRALTDLLTVDRCRSVRVAGIEGVGKTRLVMEVAERLRDRLGWPVLWVQAGPDARDGLARRLHRALSAADPAGDRDCLLVLDGVRDADDEAPAAGLLDRHPGLRIVVTACTPGGDASRRVMPVGPLPLPAERHAASPDELAAHPSVRLFLSHVRRLRPQSASLPRSVAAAAQICRRLDGVPRHLEAAAAWCLTHSPEELLDAITRDPAAFGVPLAGPAVATPGTPGSGAVRAVAALDARHRALLRRLAALPGAWTVDEAALLAGQSVVDVLRALHPMLVHGVLRAAEEDGRGCFRVLNTVRAVCLAPAPQPAAGFPAAGRRTAVLPV